ncbi:MAG: phosphatidylglycerophosphatase A [Deltaproteobacteria bacterium]|jgi:phosphatidylglycerophosphatase A|nr:phosphatidylglycerophosphatase A [Deltaproteobacteria bacterium]
MHAPLSLADRFCLHASRLWIVGRAPVMPGTCSSAVALLLAPVLFLPLSFAERCALLVALFLAGSLLTNRAERILGVQDPPELCIDEVPGMWLALVPFEDPSPGLMLAAFVLFRIFDIAKPWPVSASEDWLPGGFGIMLDDIVAGFLAMLGVWLLAAAGYL